MIRRILAAAVLGWPAAAAAAQDTQALLASAISKYEAFDIEGARPILLNILSPNYLFAKTAEQRVKALKYLGASYAILDKPDSAITFFQVALEVDPFTDLEIDKFSGAEISAFNKAKQGIFKLAFKPIPAPALIDPSLATSIHVFRFITTHKAQLTIELVNTTKKNADGSAITEILFQQQSDGLQEIPWSGLLRSGDLADSTVYELNANGLSSVVNGAKGSDFLRFRIEHLYDTLEDTLPTFTGTQLLPIAYTGSAPWIDLMKGITLGGISIGLPFLALSRTDMPSWSKHAAVASGLGFGSAAIAFGYRRQHRDISANVAENRRRLAERDAFNRGVLQRNQARILKTKLILSPATAGIAR